MPVLRTSLRCSSHRAAAQLAHQFDDYIQPRAGIHLSSGEFRALAQCSPKASRCDSAARRRTGGLKRNTEVCRECFCLTVAYHRVTPCEPPSSAAGSGVVGEDCLSPCRRQGRVPQPPESASSTGKSEGPASLGRLLLVTFLGEARKVTSRRATPGDLSWFKAHTTARSRHTTTC